MTHSFKSSIMQQLGRARPILRNDPVTMGDLDDLSLVIEEVYTKNFTVVENTLNKFHEGILRMERTTNGMWNTMNVIVSLMLDNDQIKENEIVNKGKQLYVEARENFDKLREATRKGVKPPPLKRTALEAIIATISEVNKGESEGKPS